MEHTGFPILIPQTFRGENYGAMYVPAGRVGAAQLAAVLATSFQGPMHVHAVPIMYTQPKKVPTGSGNTSLKSLGGL